MTRPSTKPGALQVTLCGRYGRANHRSGWTEGAYFGNTQERQPRSNTRTPIHMEILAALLIGERSPGLPPRNLEEIVDVKSPDPDTVAPARGDELLPVRTEGHAFYCASCPPKA